ncbi:alpha-ketoglutarate-dependent dioxygenase AlkB [Sphingomonas sp. BK580]|uniref:alpha-ketoglutarate-dependent dioxygenase AlkB n=1 Tax=Sphingomonas sp. BK580 TaxID=2586972 RepID=UPI00161DD866|nr:alpha-ketoglutarate-dependent dioxygenase AlkB [Sphingomonas sp. BK580]MBB3692425.1 alkylated DNA repair dioxygenase AlkB [Sphingomonas sp. BK580]
MDDLFDLPLLTGLCSVADFVEADEERGLIERIDSLALAPFRFQGWLGKRLTHSFGIHYDFDRAALARTDPPPPWLATVRDRAETALGLAAGTLEQALLIRYDPGAGIGWHRDRPHFDHVVGVSLGAPAAMRFRRRRGERFERRTAPLPPRGLYHLNGEARYDWEHSIAAMAATRWSITLRSLSERGRAAVGD